ncbi:MAG: DUF1367 family protein [Devosiaceae bacterium]|nr:DUF1367 family protein [Devosiaceae bacterium]
MQKKRKTKRPEKFLLRVVRGALIPVDGYTESKLREKGYRVGDVLIAALTKPRNPKFHRLAHRFGTLVASNIDEFAGIDAHSVLKRIQYEANIECDHMEVKVPEVGFVEVRTPRSLSFGSMDEGSFKQTFRGLARYIAENYWPELTEEQIAEMASSMPDEI